MICKNCGAYVEDGTKFCTSCGTPIEAPAADTTYSSNTGNSYSSDNYQAFEPAGGYYSEQPQARILSAEDPEAYRVAGSSLTFGILSVCFSWLSLLGIIFGIVGITKMRKAGKMGSKSPKKFVGLGLSIYGIIQSVIVGIYLIYVIGMFAFVFGMASDEYHSMRDSGEITDAQIEEFLEDLEDELG